MERSEDNSRDRGQRVKWIEHAQSIIQKIGDKNIKQQNEKIKIRQIHANGKEIK